MEARKGRKGRERGREKGRGVGDRGQRRGERRREEGRNEEEETGRNSKILTFPGVREWLPKSALSESSLWVDRADKAL